MSLKSKVLNNCLVRGVYKFKTYFDIGLSQISWTTGKLPELMAILYLLQWFGYKPSRPVAVIFIAFAILFVFGFGYNWYKFGFYDVEMSVKASRNVVENEVYEAAKVINKKFGDGK